MSEPSHPSGATLPSLAAEPATERRRAEITVRVTVLVLLGSTLAAWGAWAAWRVLSDLG